MKKGISNDSAKRGKNGKGAAQGDEGVVLVRYGNAVVRIYERGNGMWALAWREDGRACRTTRATREAAMEWAQEKAEKLENAVGARWVTPGEEERLRWLHRLAGGSEEAGRFLMEVEEARGVLAGRGGLLEAARWFVANGPPAAGQRTLASAVEEFCREYEAHLEPTTAKPMRVELRTLAKIHGEMDLLEVSPALLDGHCRRLGCAGDPKGKPKDRTVRNRMGMWTTFFRRAALLGWWPEGRKLPVEAFRRPKKEEAAPEVWTPEEGLAILRAVRVHLPQHLPYLLIAGWLGLRPSECQRIRRADFDWEQGLLHVCSKTAKKVRRERWVPVDARLGRVLRPLMEAAETHHRAAKEKATRKNSRMYVSAKMRELGVISRWPQDVWRHSFITYRLQIVKNTAQVADEAGNSEREIQQSYKRPVPPGEGERWWHVLEEVMSAE